MQLRGLKKHHKSGSKDFKCSILSFLKSCEEESKKKKPCTNSNHVSKGKWQCPIESMHEWIIVWVGSYQWISFSEAFWYGSRVQLNDSIIWLQWKPTKISVSSFHKAISTRHIAKDSYGPPYQSIYETQKLQFPFNVNAWKWVTSTPYGNSHFVFQRGKNDMRASKWWQILILSELNIWESHSEMHL